jgi:hypothetical protein
MELLRDPSHVRNRSAREWRSLLEAAGFVDVEHVVRRRSSLQRCSVCKCQELDGHGGVLDDNDSNKPMRQEISADSLMAA